LTFFQHTASIRVIIAFFLKNPLTLLFFTKSVHTFLAIFQKNVWIG